MELQVHKVLQALKVLLVGVEHKVQQVPQALLEQPGHKELMVHKVLQVLVETQVVVELKVFKVLLVLQVILELQVLLVL
jgi:hypothetical protein